MYEIYTKEYLFIQKIVFFFRNFIRIGIQRLTMKFLYELHCKQEKDELRVGKL